MFSCITKAADRPTIGLLLMSPYTVYDEKTNLCKSEALKVTKKILLAYSMDLSAICAPPVRIYQLMQNGELDFTINIKSTKSLNENTLFVDTPYRILQLNLYTHKELSSRKEIASVRGFNYEGHRNNFQEDGFKFIDVPDSLSSIKIFLRKRTSHLISYEAPIIHYLNENKKVLGSDITISPIVSVTSHYAISHTSPYKEKLLSIFVDYAKEHNVSTFSDLKLPAELAN